LPDLKPIKGNGGTSTSTDPKIEGVKLNAADFPAMIKFAQEKGVTLVVPGPEQPLVDGISDAFKKGGDNWLDCWGRDDFIDDLRCSGQPAFSPLDLRSWLRGLKAPRHIPRTL
jgi:hypothetical protein